MGGGKVRGWASRPAERRAGRGHHPPTEPACRGCRGLSGRGGQPGPLRSVPKGTAGGWHTVRGSGPQGGSGPCARTLVYWLFAALCLGCCFPPPPPSGWSLPGQVLPAPPRSGKELGVQFLENPGHSRHKERSHMRRPLLPLIEGVPLTEAKSPGRVPERGRWQAWQGPQAPPASHANHVSC